MGFIPILSLVISITGLSIYLLLTSKSRFLLKSMVTKIKRQEWRFKYGKLNYLRSRFLKTITIAVIIMAAIIAGNTVSAQVTPSPLPSLKSISVPQPDNLGDFVKDKVAAVKLGKTLFWDMQVGSDGVTACASCHFHAGADNRSKNQIAPGLLRINPDGTENPDAVFNVGGLPNYQLKPGDFPFHSNDVSSSQGIFNSKFVDVTPGNAEDKVTNEPDPVFNVGGINVRRVEPRNTPTVINSAFNFRNFWDGRAQNIFNGVNPFGLRDPNAAIAKAANPNKLEFVKVSLKNSSLASQAVGPPLSSFESSADGRTFQEIGDKFGRIDRRSLSAGKGKKLPRKLAKKLLPLRPLGKQVVHPQDSVLGADSRSPKPGLKDKTYGQLIQDAFKPEWWKSNQLIQVDAEGRRTFVKKPDRSLETNEYTLMEYNFSLFFGLAVQLYESTLIANDTPFDRFLEGNTNALTSEQQQGKQLFEGKAFCIACHVGSELTAASTSNVTKEGRIKRAPFPPNSPEDTGFFNIGVTPTTEDPSLGSKDAFGNPLSEARLAQLGKFQLLLGENPPTLNPPLNPTETVFADGAFKAPGLRNVELTAPYFHNGGHATLEQVIDFYNRGGNLGLLPPLGLSPEEKQQLVAFLKGLTDERVRYEKAPFDHPQLFVPNGHPSGSSTAVINDGTGKATDSLLEIPAVGKNGGSGTPNFLS
ncbi:cytochrome c peroxidase [Nostoc sp. C057]|uniref:cytochrome-c peroxidase n=1 Tax=Nostoc sp. C057 TaxID=2576903 RepID=UPI0015C2F688